MNAYHAYRQTQTQTASPGELVVMLYRGAIRFVSKGIAALESQDIQGSHTNLVRAQEIVAELLGTLDLARGGEIADQLLGIYEYLNRRLVDANLTKDAAPAREVERFLRELLPAWEEAARQASPAPASTLSLAVVA
jgi:flagellar protein FliS